MKSSTLNKNNVKYKNLILLFFCLSILLSSCKKDNGEVITKEIKVKSFSTVTNKTNIPINIKYGATQKLEITGNTEIIRKVKTVVNNNNLIISLQKVNTKNYELAINLTISKQNKKSIKDWTSILINEYFQSRN